MSGDPAHEIGVVLLTRSGMPRLDAEVTMLSDARYRAWAEQMIPSLQRLAREVSRICAAIGKIN